MYAFPNQYEAEEKGLAIPVESLNEANNLADVGILDYISQEHRQELSSILKEPEKVSCNDIVEAFNFMMGSDVLDTVV